MSAEDNKSNEPHAPQASAVGEHDVDEERAEPTTTELLEQIRDLRNSLIEVRRDARSNLETLERELRANEVANEALRAELNAVAGTARTAAVLTAATRPAPNRMTSPMSPTITFNHHSSGLSLAPTPSANIFMSPSLPRAAASAVPAGARTVVASSSSAPGTSTRPKISLKDYPTYSGIPEDGNTIRRFALVWMNIAAAQGISLADDVDTSQVIVDAATRLTDGALEWYADVWLPIVAAMAPTKPRWSDFISALQGQFEPLPPSFIARTELRSLTQTGSLQEYINKFRDLSASIPDMAEADRVDRFISGLKPALQAKVSMSLPENMITATTVAVRQEAAYQAMTHRTPRPAQRPNRQPNPVPATRASPAQELGHITTTDSDEDNEEKQTLAAIQAPRSAKLSDERKADLMRAGKCFNCYQVGHLSKNCPRKQPKN
jgi:hypothetical protein